MASETVIRKLDSEIYQVLVYQRQARITRIVNTSVSDGKEQLAVLGIPNNVDTSTIQVKGKGDFTILGIRFEHKELDKKDYPKRLKELSDAVDVVDEKLIEVENKLFLLNQEEEFLRSNQKIGGVNETLSVEQIREMANYMNQGFSQLVVSRQKANKLKKQLDEDRAILWKEFEEQLGLCRESNTQAILDIEAGSDSQAIFTLDYIVRNAGWYAEYDVRAESEGENLDVSYKANVYQHTGEKWKDVRLTLSSGNPSLNNSKPILNPWYITAEMPMPTKPRKMLKKSLVRSSAPQKEIMMSSMAELDADEIETSIKGSVQSNETAININYEIDLRYDIPTGGEPIAIGLLEFQPLSEFSYSAVPKVDSCAFLTAKIQEWEIGNLLPGNMNIYLDGAYVGKTYLDTRTTDQGIIVSLGRDERIQVSRQQLKHLKSSGSFIGNKKKEQFNFLISVKNTTAKEITIKVEDQLPVSKDGDINVKVGDLADAKLDNDKGILYWELSLEASSTKELKFNYDVSYPKDKPPHGLV